MSWVPSAAGHSDFPLENLPIGVFSPPGGDPRGGVAIGDDILDLREALAAGALDGHVIEAAAGPTLNAFLSLGAAGRAELRKTVSGLLAAEAPASVRALGPRILHRAVDCGMHLPATIGDYTDFYAGIHHAMNTGRLLRPDNPLLPNYKHMPIAYHGRASSVRPSGTQVRRPHGQRKPANEAEPSFGPCRNLDYELELGVWIGPGNTLGEPIPIDQAEDHIAGVCLLNDWSARDIQGWEYQPLGPFLGKSFTTSISPWIVMPEALAPYRIAQPRRPDSDPKPLPYLWSERDQARGGLEIALEVLLLTRSMADAGLPPHRLSAGNASALYWTVAQMVAHHTSGGCDLRPGDLFGSGTISMEAETGWGSLLELSRGGRTPVALPNGETRRFLEDGDEVILRGRAGRIGLGACRGRVVG